MLLLIDFLESDSPSQLFLNTCLEAINSESCSQVFVTDTNAKNSLIQNVSISIKTLNL